MEIYDKNVSLHERNDDNCANQDDNIDHKEHQSIDEKSSMLKNSLSYLHNPLENDNKNKIVQEEQDIEYRNDSSLSENGKNHETIKKVALGEEFDQKPCEINHCEPIINESCDRSSDFSVQMHEFAELNIPQMFEISTKSIESAFQLLFRIINDQNKNHNALKLQFQTEKQKTAKLFLKLQQQYERQETKSINDLSQIQMKYNDLMGHIKEIKNEIQVMAYNFHGIDDEEQDKIKKEEKVDNKTKESDYDEVNERTEIIHDETFPIIDIVRIPEIPEKGSSSCGSDSNSSISTKSKNSIDESNPVDDMDSGQEKLEPLEHQTIQSHKKEEQNEINVIPVANPCDDEKCCEEPTENGENTIQIESNIEEQDHDSFHESKSLQNSVTTKSSNTIIEDCEDDGTCDDETKLQTRMPISVPSALNTFRQAAMLKKKASTLSRRASINISKQKLDVHLTVGNRLERLEECQQNMKRRLSEQIMNRNNITYDIDDNFEKRLKVVENFLLGFGVVEVNNLGKSDEMDNILQQKEEEEENDPGRVNIKKHNLIDANECESIDVRKNIYPDQLKKSTVNNEILGQCVSSDFITNENHSSSLKQNLSKAVIERVDTNESQSSFNISSAIQFDSHNLKIDNIDSDLKTCSSKESVTKSCEHAQSDKILNSHDLKDGESIMEDKIHQNGTKLCTAKKSNALSNYYHTRHSSLISHLNDLDTKTSERIDLLARQLHEFGDKIEKRISRKSVDNIFEKISLASNQNNDSIVSIKEIEDINDSIHELGNRINDMVSKSELESIIHAGLNINIDCDGNDGNNYGTTDILHSFKIHMEDKLRYLNDTKLEMSDITEKFSLMKKNFSDDIEIKLNAQKAIIQNSSDKLTYDVGACRTYIDALDRKIEQIAAQELEENSELDLDERIKEVTDTVHKSLHETLSKKLEDVQIIEDELVRIASQIADRPDQNQVVNMLQDLEEALSDRVGNARTLQMILNNLKIEMKSKMNRNDVLSLVKQILDETKQGIQNTKDSLMVGRTPAYRCLGCDRKFPGGINGRRARPVNHKALPSSGVLSVAKTAQNKESFVIGRPGALRPLHVTRDPRRQRTRSSGPVRLFTRRSPSTTAHHQFLEHSAQYRTNKRSF